jgi:hypothetical protein
MAALMYLEVGLHSQVPRGPPPSQLLRMLDALASWV